MKTSFFTFIALLIAGLTAAAQDLTARNAPDKSAYTVTERGAHHRVWERTADEIGPDGKPFPRKRSYTELSTGLHFRNERGEWEESKEEIEILPDNAGAIARNGQHKAIFPPEISTGLIELQTPEGQWLRSRVWGLAYFDAATGESVLLAEVKESEGQLVGNNVVVYPDAFTDFRADIRLTYFLAGFEQDVVLKESPPTPQELGLNPETTRLQVLTEFVEAAPPTKTRQPLGQLSDDTLGFSGMTIGLGKAFSVNTTGDRTGDVPVAKQWEHLEGRDFLIEEIPFEKVAEQLQKLPAAGKYQGASLQRRGTGESTLAGLKTLLPKRYAKAAPNPLAKPKRMAKAHLDAAPSFVMDYITLTSQTNYTFQADTTYLINGTVNLSGTTTIEGNTVIKFAKTNTARININDPQLVLRTDAYRPAVFTAKDDNSVGQSVGGTGNPSGYYGGGLYYAGFASGTNLLGNLRFCHLQNALMLGWDASQAFTVANAQFRLCQNALYYTGGLIAQNCLFTQIGTVLTTPEEETTCAGAHWTLTECDVLNNAWQSDLQLDNCLLVTVTNLDGPGVYLSGWTTNAVARLANPAGVFQTVGGGAHYLAANSPYRNTGTTNITASLLAALKTKTTYPPVAYTNVTFTTPTTFNPQAQRDTDTPDLGYHYDPLDYSFGGCHANSNITFTAGTAVGWFRAASGYNHTGQGLHLGDKQIGLFDGTATAPCYWVRLNTVQENDRTAGFGPGGFTGWANTSANVADLRARFTRFSMMSYDGNHLRDDNHYLNVRAQDCEFYGGGAGGYGISMYFTNCLFLRTYLAQVAGGNREVVFRNCTVIGERLQLLSTTTTTFVIVDSAFDGTAFTFSGLAANGSYATYDYNAYTNTTRPFPSGIGGTHDVPVSGSFNWQTGPLGNFYLPTNSTLINTGSVNAPNIALYHFTTQTNQTKEATSQVDISYHYVAVDGNNVPQDSDSDGLANYLEDANGDGSFNAGDLGNWNSADPDGDGVFDWIEIAQGRNPNSLSLPGAVNDGSNATKLSIYTPLRK